MPIREFVDENGVRWKVWSTIPYTTGVAGSMKRGWLTFESQGARRRLFPIPDDWEEASVARLRMFCRDAQATSRGTPGAGSARIEREES